MYQGDLHAAWLATIAPLKEKRFTLTTLPEINVNDSPAVGIKAAYPNRPDVTLYFDKKTNLLVRVTFKGKEAGAAVTKESTFSEYKDFGGLMLPGKQVDLHDRRKVAEWKTTNYESVEKLGKEVFAKP